MINNSFELDLSQIDLTNKKITTTLYSKYVDELKAKVSINLISGLYFDIDKHLTSKGLKTSPKEFSSADFLLSEIKNGLYLDYNRKCITLNNLTDSFINSLTYKDILSVIEFGAGKISPARTFTAVIDNFNKILKK